jgi:Na+/proline symporter
MESTLLVSKTSGWLMLLAYGVGTLALTWFILNRERWTKRNYLVANNQMGQYYSIFSLATAWIWAPALFISAQKAYQEGWVGLFWFLVPNVLCLIVFSEFAVRFREKFPKGYTISEYMGFRFSKRVQNLYIFELISLDTCCFAVQLLAGGSIFAALTGISYFWVTVGMAIMGIMYTMSRGVKASIVTDVWLYGVMVAIAGSLVPWVIYSSGGWSTLAKGLNGVSGEYTSLFSGKGGSVFWTFGLSVTIGLMSGPFGDQQMWQRVLTPSRSFVRKSCIWGAVAFGVVPLLMSGLGFTGAAIGFKSPSAQLINLQMILKYLPIWTVFPFIILLLAGLVSTLGSSSCAVSSIAGHDLCEKWGGKNPLMYARLSVVAQVLVALAIVNIPKMQILYLFLFYGTLRASVLLPTAMAIVSDKLTEKGIFWGILLAICVGLPVFSYGNFFKVPMFVWMGSLLTVGISGGVAYFTSILGKKKEHEFIVIKTREYEDLVLAKERVYDEAV